MGNPWWLRIVEVLGVGLGFSVVFMGFMIPFMKFVINKVSNSESITHIKKCAENMERIADAVEKVSKEE